jgi:Mn-dependent DtxR family transcriptional regulator
MIKKSKWDGFDHSKRLTDVYNLLEAKGELPLTNIASKLNISESYAYRLIAEMIDLGWVITVQNNRYKNDLRKVRRKLYKLNNAN